MHRQTHQRHRETNTGQWECPNCHRKAHEPDNLPPPSNIAAWAGICAQHAPDCEWCREYAPPDVWKQQPTTVAAPAEAILVRDPVCGQQVRTDRADAMSVYQAESYYFCSEECKQEFDRDPAGYVRQPSPGEVPVGVDAI